MKVLTFADLHLRSTVPSCIDCTPTEWMKVQKDALDKVVSVALEHDVNEVYVGGDIFHSEQSTSFECIILFQEFVNKLHISNIPVYIMAGNHDLPQHSSLNINFSAIGVLFNSNNVLLMQDSKTIKGCNFDVDEFGDSKYIFKHILCIPENEKPDIVDCDTPKTLLDKYPNAEIIFTGDYHRKFAFTENGRFVINSGCLTKQASDFEDYETGVFVTDLNSKEVIWCPVNIPQKFVKNHSIKKIDNSIDDFINSLNKASSTLDFINVLKNKLDAQDSPVKNKVESWIEEIGQ